MAGNVKKGFGTYLLILLLMVVAAFLITCVVMIFQPFKTVLGYKYFTYNETTPFEYYLTDDETQEINFKEKDIIRINSSYAKVRIEKNTKVDDVAVVVVNNAKGIAKATQNTDFSYKIIASEENEKKVLDISVSEPQGVLFFQKEVEICLLVPYYDTENASHDISGKQIIITTESGKVVIGNQKELNNEKDGHTHTYKTINPTDLSIQTSSGDVYFYPYLNDDNLQKLNVKTNSGNVNVLLNLHISNKIKFRTESGTLTANQINTPADNEFIVSNGKLNADIIKGNLNLLIKSGEFIVKTMDGCLTANNSAITGKNAEIVINNVNGDVSLPFLGNSTVKIKKINGQAYMEGDNCNIKIDEISGVSWFKTTGGNINIYTTANDITAQTTKGKITIYYASDEIANELSLSSTSGNIYLYILPSLAYKMQVSDTNGNLRTKNVKVEPFEEYVNPLVVNGGNKEINFVSNGKINVSLFSI